MGTRVEASGWPNRPSAVCPVTIPLVAASLHAGQAIGVGASVGEHARCREIAMKSAEAIEVSRA